MASRSSQACATHRERVLGGQERDDVAARHIGAEIDDEMAEVVLFAFAHGAVREKHERASAHEPADGMIRVNPRVHPGFGAELRAWRPQLDGHKRRRAVQGIEQNGRGTIGLRTDYC